MARKIHVTVEIPWSGIDNVDEYYDLPDGWDQMSTKEQDDILNDMGATELTNTGIGYGAEVVDTDE